MIRWQRVAILGLGLIGSSLARVLKNQGLAVEVIAAGSRLANLQRGVELGVIDGYTHSLLEAVDGADLVVLAMPVGSMRCGFEAIRQVWSRGQRPIVTDVGSVKGAVVGMAVEVMGEWPSTFVPGHPIAGSERSGVEAGSADLFRRHKVILTPGPDTDACALERIQALWRLSGAEVLQMPVEDHDRILAKTSHLPHILAFSLVDSLARESENLEIFRYAAGGFRDFTRIAGSDPRMWHDIALANRSAILDAIQLFRVGLDRLEAAIAECDSAALEQTFERAKKARDHFSFMLASTAYAKTGNIMTEYHVQPGGCVRGTIRVPGDKSISHRSIMLGALAEGMTRIEGFLEGEDALATLQAFRDMGVRIDGPEQGRVDVYGVGLNGLRAPEQPLYLGNSGTSMRLLSGILAAQSFSSVLTGDDSLSRRPMERIAAPLRLMGARIDSTGDRGTPPLRIHGGQMLRGMEYSLPMASAQVKSGLLLAGLWAQGATTIHEPAPTRDHTERMLRGFGCAVDVGPGWARVQGGQRLQATSIDVPADISSAAFFMVAASIAPDSDIVLEHVGINPTRTGVIDILRLMGARIDIMNMREAAGEPVADLRVQSAPLQGIEIPGHLVPLAIDEFPVLFVAAACAQGETILRGAEELRVKESDRIQVMADGLQKLGIEAVPMPDGMVIRGGSLGSGRVDSHGDHRIAMSFTVAALRAEGTIEISDCANVATSFPGFAQLAQRAGIAVQVVEHNES